VRVEVFNGWVELRDPELVPERLRRPVIEQSVKAGEFADEDLDSDTLDSALAARTMDFYSTFNDLLALALVSEWSFASPVTLEALVDLPARTYDDIRKAIAPFIKDMMPDFSVDIDPKAPTVS